MAKTVRKVFTRFSGWLVGQVANNLAFMEERLLKYYPVLRVSLTLSLQGSKGWRGGESTRLPPIWSGFKSRRRRPGLRISERLRQFCFFTKRSTLLLEKSRKINFLHLFFIEQHAKLVPFLLMLVDQVKS